MRSFTAHDQKANLFQGMKKKIKIKINAFEFKSFQS